MTGPSSETLAQATEDEGGASSPRVVGPLAAFSIVAGSMLGIGIFLTPMKVANELHTTPLFLLAWLLGGFIALCGAVAYAELGAMFPRAGGDYVFLRRAFGPSLAFASGWLLFAGVFAGSIATMAVPVWQYQMPVLLAPWVEWDAGRVLIGPFTWGNTAALGLLLVLTVANVAGTRIAAGLQVLLTMVPFGVLTLAAIWVLATGPHASAVPWEAVSQTPDVLWEGSLVSAMLRASLAIYFAYAGWNAVGYIGGELRNPGRTMPVALLGGTAAITALYLLLCGAFVAVLGMGGLTRAFEAGTAAAGAVGGPRAQYVVTLMIALALVGSLNGTILTGARIGMAMARDGAISRVVGGLHPRFRTPAPALWLQASIAAVLILTGTFDALLELTGIAMLLMGSMTVLALFALRHRAPDAPRPWRALGYPVLPAIYLLVGAAIVGLRSYEILATPEASVAHWLPLFGVLLLAVGWAAHASFAKRAA